MKTLLALLLVALPAFAQTPAPRPAPTLLPVDFTDPASGDPINLTTDILVGSKFEASCIVHQDCRIVQRGVLVIWHTPGGVLKTRWAETQIQHTPTGMVIVAPKREPGIPGYQFVAPVIVIECPPHGVTFIAMSLRKLK